MKTRRRLLTLGFLTATGAALVPFGDPEISFDSEVLSILERRLRGISEWTRTKGGEDGTAEIECGVADAQDWARRVLPLMVGRVRAVGNALSFTTGGQRVRLIIIPLHTA
jgi:hypothetical protein